MIRAQGVYMEEFRRAAPRIPLDVPCFLSLVVNRAERLQAMAVDVCRNGVRLALPPGGNEECILSGAAVELENVSAPLDRILEGVNGQIAWVGERCCGIKLEKELPVDVSDLARL